MKMCNDIKSKKRLLVFAKAITISFIALAFMLVYTYHICSNLNLKNQSQKIEIESLQEFSQSLYHNNTDLKLIVEDYNVLVNQLTKEINRLVIHQKNLEFKIKKFSERR